MLFRIDFEIGIYPDRIQVSDRRSGRFVDFRAEVPFSAQDRLIADPVYFENALAKALRKLMSGGFILLDARANVLPASLAEQDRQVVRSALRNIGFKRIAFDETEDEQAPPRLPSSFASLF
ncbi:hypothetical protein [Qipengyuania sp.]|uniref:hypothetical protein n=1 Tax=Qipengyuania sp. TaxID=2004515 RepID=UPI0035C85A62